MLKPGFQTNTPHSLLIFAILFNSFFAAEVTCAERDFNITASDGYVLDGKIRTPGNTLIDQPEQVIVLIHGSGAQSMDSDLTTVTRDGKKNLFFVDLANVFTSEGCAVVRYNKRSYQLGLSVRQDPLFGTSSTYQSFIEKPLHFFLQDAVDAVNQIGKAFPDAVVYVLGHSQGTYIAMQVAHQLPRVKGVVLIGFALQNMETLLFEQTVYRPLGMFRKMDADHNDLLDVEELGSDNPLATQLSAQMTVLDRNRDGAISIQELQAGNLCNSLLGSIGLHLFKPEEARHPQFSEVLAKAEYRVLFLQGMLDNQTPAYNAMAVEIVAENVWKKNNFRFVFFPGLGHALDQRADYDDLSYGLLDDEAKITIARELRDFLLLPITKQK